MALTKGFKSTEFWLHLILQIIMFLNTTNVWNYMPPKYSALVQAIIFSAYAGSRGLAKLGTNSEPSPPTNNIN